MGGQVKVAQSLGAGDAPLAGRFAQNSLQLGLLLSTVTLPLIMLVLNKPLIGFFNLNDPTVVRDARTYLVVVSLGIVSSVTLLVFTGLITATGNSKTPFIATVLGSFAQHCAGSSADLRPGPHSRHGRGGCGSRYRSGTDAGGCDLSSLRPPGYPSVLPCSDTPARPELPLLRELLRIGLPSAMQSMLFLLWCPWSLPG